MCMHTGQQLQRPVSYSQITTEPESVNLTNLDWYPSNELHILT